MEGNFTEVSPVSLDQGSSRDHRAEEVARSQGVTTEQTAEAQVAALWEEWVIF